MQHSTVLIADPSETVRGALRRTLSHQPGIEVVACCETAEEAVSKSREGRPDVVALGLGFPVSRRLAAVRRFRRLRPAPAVLVLAGRPELHEFLSCVRAGARGYLAADSDDGRLTDAVRDLSAGLCVVEPGIVADLFAYIAKKRPAGSRHEAPGTTGQALNRLSPRERQVMALMAQGKTNREIGVQLVTSEGTAKTHVRHILRKLKVSDRTGAVLAVLGIDPSEALPLA